MNVSYFIANSPHYLPTVFPLIRKTGGIILTFNKNAARNPGHVNKNIDILYYKNYKWLVEDFSNLSIDLMVHPGFSIQYFKKLEGVKHVQIFHGTSDKPFNYHKSLKRYDLIAVPGPRMKEEILRKRLSEPGKIAVIGYPKIDMFLHSDFSSTAFKNEIGIDSEKKTVLYSPTWDDPDSYSSFSEYVVPVMRSLKNFNVIIKPHPDIFKYRPWQILKAYIMRKGNCFMFPKSCSILPFMAVSDILLTDISSVSHEYLPFDKPMAFLSPKPEEIIPEEHKWIWSCGDVIENKRDILKAVEENLENPYRYKKERDSAFKQVFLDFDGKSALRFKDELMKLINKFYQFPCIIFLLVVFFSGI